MPRNGMLRSSPERTGAGLCRQMERNEPTRCTIGSPALSYWDLNNALHGSAGD